MPDFKGYVRQHVSSLTLPQRREDKIVDELAAQLEEAFDALVAAGRSEQEAWSELQRQMPDAAALREELLDAEPAIVRMAQPERAAFVGAATRTLLSRGRALLATGFARDLQSSARLLLRDRGFTVTTILTLAVCLGANAAIFTVVYAVLLRPLPVPEAERIVAMGDVYPTVTPNDILSNDVPSYFDRLEAITALEEQALFTFWYDTLRIGGTAEELRGMKATPSLFRVLRVEPILGRTFTDEEAEIGADQKIILSYGLWQRLYGGDPRVIGRDVRLGWTGQRYTIVGVMPRGFSFFDIGDDGHARAPGDDFHFWLPLALAPEQRSDAARTRYGFYHVGRLRPGATVGQVRAQLDALNAATFARFPQLGLAELGMYTAVTPLQEALTRDVRRILYLLWGAAAFVLLIGALNLANLSLARASVRGRELATRLALGAGRLRVTRQLIVEGVLLASVGGLAGVAVGAWMVRTVVVSGMATMPNAASIQVDRPVVVLIMAISVIVGVAIGVVPATAAGKVDVIQLLAHESRAATAGRATRVFRRGLVVTQVACSVVLLIGAMLLLTSFRNLLASDVGFDAERVTTATIFPPPSRYADQAAVVALTNRVLDAIRTIPGVTAAGMTSNIALSGLTRPATVFPADDIPRPDAPLVLPSVVAVTPGYFEAMRTPLVRGRYFSERDQEHTLRVAIVDERLAARFWPNEDPIGRSVRRGNSDRYTVVGVVRDVRFQGLADQTDAIGAAYFPHTQAPPLGRLRWIAVKTSVDLPALVDALRTSVQSVDPDLPLADIQTMMQRTTRSVAAQQLAMALAGTFGVVALFLSALGLYGVLAYVVSQKTREIGIRVALGSTPRAIFQLFFREGAALVAGGLGVGVLGALAMSRALEGQVFGVEPTDPTVLAAVAAATGVVALLACVSPAYGATRVDPLRVLNAQ